MKRILYYSIIILFAASALTFRPGLWLVHKSANTQNERYIKGWEDGCTSGTNSYSLLFAPLLDRPFIKETESSEGEKPAATSESNYYKTAWNEGFTLCRYYQAAVYELMQFILIISTLLFIGYQLKRQKP